MLPDRVSKPGALTYESGALPIALRGPQNHEKQNKVHDINTEKEKMTAENQTNGV